MHQVPEAGYGDHQQDRRDGERDHQFEKTEATLVTPSIGHRVHQQLPLVVVPEESFTPVLVIVRFWQSSLVWPPIGAAVAVNACELLPAGSAATATVTE